MSRPDLERLRTQIPSGRGPDVPPIKGPPYWNTHRAKVFGQYPKSFIPWACRQIGVQQNRVLHVCSGALAEGRGVRVDIRDSVGPDVVADGQRLPFADNSFPGALLDPPYSPKYARELYGTEYPRSSRLIREAVRVVVPGGRIGFLHQIYPFPVQGAANISTTAIATGCGFAMRCFVVFEVSRQIELIPSGA